MARLMEWADEFRKIGVRANVDTPADARVAVLNGTEGIGLCRTEHMFFSDPERIRLVRRMIMAVRTVPYYTLLYSTVLYGSLLYSTVLCHCGCLAAIYNFLLRPVAHSPGLQCRRMIMAVL